jgi:propionyl-CoA carboxylase alpha chain
VTTNLDFVNAILNHPAFIDGQLSTAFIEEYFQKDDTAIEQPKERLEAMVIAATMVYHNRQNLVRESLKPMTARVGPSHKPDQWRQYVVKGKENIFEVQLLGNLSSPHWSFKVNGNDYTVISPVFEFYRRRLKLKINDQYHYFRLEYQGNFIWVAFSGFTCVFEIYTPREWELAQFMPAAHKAGHDNKLVSPLPGMVVEILVSQGDRVYRGQDVIVIESMKMECGVSSPCDGTVEKVTAAPGKAVETGDVLISFKT